MSSEYVGPTFALLTALSWAVAVVLFKKSGTQIEPLALNLLKNCLALVLVLLTALVMHSSTGNANTTDVVMLLISGAIGIGIADTLLLTGLNLTGAAHQAIVETTYSPAVVVLSYFMLGEVLTPMQAVGGTCILGAVAIGSGHSSGPRLPARVYVRGIALGATSMVLMAFAIVWVKPVLERHDVLFCTAVRLLGGLLALLVMARTSPARWRMARGAFVPNSAWRYAIPGAICGTYVSLLCWIAAFKYSAAGIAALLNQTSTLFIVLLAAKFLREPLTVRLILAVGLALTGSVIVLLRLQ